MSRKVLGISWLNGQFRAVAMDGRKVCGSWCSSKRVDDSAFGEALAEAVRETRFSGRKVMLVIDHRSLLFQFQDTPPVADKLADQILGRAMERSPLFEGKITWARLPLPSNTSRRRFLLALLPSAVVRNLSEQVAGQELELEAVLPLTSVLATHLRKPEVQPAESAVLVTDLGDALHLLVGKIDGTPLFARTIVVDISSNPERAHQEINRTLQFVQQQFGASVGHMYVTGTAAFERLKELPFPAGLKIEPEPAIQISYYAEAVAALSCPFPLNLAPPCPIRARRLEAITARAVAASCCIALATVILVEGTVRARVYAREYRARQLEGELQLRANAKDLWQQAKRWEAFLQAVGTTNDVPVAEAFARYLSKISPDMMRLTRVDLNDTSSPDGWSCRIEGVVRERGESFIAGVEALERELANGPFKLHISDSTSQRLFRGNSETGLLQPAPADERAFFITGNIR